MTRGAFVSYALSCGVCSLMMLTHIFADISSEDPTGRLSAFQADPNLYSKVLIVGALAAIGLAHIRTEKRPRSCPCCGESRW